MKDFKTFSNDTLFGRVHQPHQLHVSGRRGKRCLSKIEGANGTKTQWTRRWVSLFILLSHHSFITIFLVGISVYKPKHRQEHSFNSSTSAKNTEVWNPCASDLCLCAVGIFLMNANSIGQLIRCLSLLFIDPARIGDETSEQCLF